MPEFKAKYDPVKRAVMVSAEGIDSISRRHQRFNEERAILAEMRRRTKILNDSPQDVNMDEMKAQVIIQYETYDDYLRIFGQYEGSPVSFQRCMSFLEEEYPADFRLFNEAMYRANQERKIAKATTESRQETSDSLASLSSREDPIVIPPLRDLETINTDLKRLISDQGRQLENLLKRYTDAYGATFSDFWRMPVYSSSNCKMTDALNEAYARGFVSKLSVILDSKCDDTVRIMALEALLKKHWEKYKNTSFNLLADCKPESLQGQVKNLLCNLAQQIAEVKGISAIDLLMPDLAPDDSNVLVKESLKAAGSSGISLLENVKNHSRPTPLISFELYKSLEPMSINAYIFAVEMFADVVNSVSVEDLEQFIAELNLINHLQEKRIPSHWLLQYLDREHLIKWVKHLLPAHPVIPSKDYNDFIDNLIYLVPERARIVIDVVQNKWFKLEETIRNNLNPLAQDVMDPIRSRNKMRTQGLALYVEKIAPLLYQTKDCSPESFLWLFSNLSVENKLAFKAIFEVPENLDIILHAKDLVGFLPYLPSPQFETVASKWKEKNPKMLDSEEGKYLFFSRLASKLSDEQRIALYQVFRKELIESITKDATLLMDQRVKIRHDIITALNSIHVSALFAPGPETLQALESSLLRPSSRPMEPDPILLQSLECAFKMKNIGFILEVLYHSPGVMNFNAVEDPNELKTNILKYVELEPYRTRFSNKMNEKPSQIGDFFATSRYSSGYSKNKENKLCEIALEFSGTPKERVRAVREELQDAADPYTRDAGGAEYTVLSEESTVPRFIGLKDSLIELRKRLKPKSAESDEENLNL